MIASFLLEHHSLPPSLSFSLSLSLSLTLSYLTILLFFGCLSLSLDFLYDILGRPISLDNFCPKLAWENTHELMDQPKILPIYFQFQCNGQCRCQCFYINDNVVLVSIEKCENVIWPTSNTIDWCTSIAAGVEQTRHNFLAINMHQPNSFGAHFEFP